MKTILALILIFASNFVHSIANAQGEHQGHDSNMAMGSGHQMAMGPKDCSEMEIWDYSSGSCKPLNKGKPAKMWMLHGNAFLVQTLAEGPRGRSEFAVPNMIMGDVGSTVGERHYLNVNLMMTFEKWTFPKRGYPELLQIGEHDGEDQPYIDAQHPHSSPIMGLTLSDTIRIGEGKDHLRIFFAPRGQPTDGPIAFMHRPTGMVNPDAPLGHHVGQDVAHITSTVFGASLALGRTRVEASTFNGAEPESTKVDLPLGKLNSYSARLIYKFSQDWSAMVSAAQLKDPEPHDPDITKVERYSASLYGQHQMSSGWMFHNTTIFGLVNFYDRISALRSVLHEFWLHQKDVPHNFWGRVEFVERAPAQLGILGNANSLGPKWVTALTAGYTHDLRHFNFGTVGLGTSITKNFIPSEFENSYGGDPISGRIFIQLSGMGMGHF